MVAFGHTALGASVGLLTYHILGRGDIALGLIVSGTAGVISHYLADLIPHGHFFNESGYKNKIFWVIIFDLLLSLLLFLTTAHLSRDSAEKILYLLFGIGGAQLPDALDGLIYIDLLPRSGILKWENNFHRSTHWHGTGKNTLLIGYRDLWQLATVIISLYLIINF